MAQVTPFRGVRYSPRIAAQDVVSPPYDVLSASQAAGLASRSPYNAVHVDLPVPPGATATDAAYEAAAASFRRWMDEGVLVRDDRESVYVLETAYRGPDGRDRRRLGVVARLRLADFGERIVLPHEHTHKGPKLDRLRLYRATHADLSPIFLLYPDDDGAVTAGMRAAADAIEPAAWTQAPDPDGNLHRLAPLYGDAASRAAAGLSRQTLYIADGHHRYETALAYRDERRAAGDHSADTLMAYLCAMNDPGLTVFPTHRLIRYSEAPAMAEALERLAPVFAVVGRAEGARCADLLRQLPAAERPATTFGLYFPQEDACCTVELRDQTALDRLEARGFSPRAARLSVTILHQLVLARGIGLDPASSEANVDYAKGTDEALARLHDGGYTLGAFLNATRVDDVRAIADGGEAMPQKSTYFYPKLLTGLIFDRLDD